MSLTIQDIQKTAQVVVQTLKEAGMSSCLVGSAALSEHGITRIPNDVDVLVLSADANAEHIKESMPHRNSDFSLARPSHNPQANYHVLWYKVVLPTASDRQSKTCRVDIFVPGVISLPAVPLERVVHSHKSGLPLLPFLAALLHKVLAWVAHGKSSTQHGRDKQAADASDIRELLELASTTYMSSLTEEKWLPDWFTQAAAGGVAQYVLIYPTTAPMWVRLGLDPQVPGSSKPDVLPNIHALPNIS